MEHINKESTVDPLMKNVTYTGQVISSASKSEPKSGTSWVAYSNSNHATQNPPRPPDDALVTGILHNEYYASLLESHNSELAQLHFSIQDDMEIVHETLEIKEKNLDEVEGVGMHLD